MDHRAVTGFSRLSFKALGRVELTQSDVEDLNIEASPEICAKLKTEVIDDTLIISYSNDWVDWLSTPLFGQDAVVFHLQMKNIHELALSGAGTLKSEKIITESLKIILSGPGKMQITNLAAVNLNLNLSGVGSIVIGGKTETQNVNLSGAGNYSGDHLESENADIHLSGVGNARVWVKSKLAATISGAGAIEYIGNPQLEKHISGIGMLKSAGDR